MQHVAAPYSGLLLALPSGVEWCVGAAVSSSLSGCTSSAIYTAWGTTFQTAWPTFNYLCTVGSVTCAMCITNGNIGTAVMAWLTNSTAAATTYGNIVEWNTAAVSDMASLFYPSSYARPTFNSDISKWNTASVSSMSAVCSYYRTHADRFL